MLDVALALDHSGSIEDSGQGNWATLINFVNRLVGSLQPGQANDQMRLAAVGFGNRATVYFNLDRYSNTQEFVSFFNGLAHKVNEFIFIAP